MREQTVKLGFMVNGKYEVAKEIPMSKTPRTEKLRRKLEREKASWEACAIKMIELCRTLEWELSYFNGETAAYCDHLKEVASELETELNEAKKTIQECLPELEFAFMAARQFRSDMQRSDWGKDVSHLNEKEIENTKKLIEKINKIKQ